MPPLTPVSVSAQAGIAPAYPAQPIDCARTAVARAVSA
jgi:hypothetical protein